MQNIAVQMTFSSTVREETPWDDYEDGGGFDDDASLMGKPATFADRISEAGFRELLGFENGRQESFLRREA